MRDIVNACDSLLIAEELAPDVLEIRQACDEIFLKTDRVGK